MNDNSLKIEIPVPWSTKPVRIHAAGVLAVVLAAIVAITLVLSWMLSGQ